MIRKLCYLLLFLLGVFSVAAQGTFSFESSSDTVLIGDPVTLNFAFNLSSTVDLEKIDLNPLKKRTSLKQKKNETGREDYLPDFEIADYGQWAPGKNLIIESASEVPMKNSITLIFWEEGQFQIESPIGMVRSSGISKEIKSPQQVIITVLSPISDSLRSNDLAPIKPIIKEPVLWIDYLPAILFLSGLFIVGLIWYFLNKRKKVEEQKEEVRLFEVPVHKIALQKLKTLKRKDYLEKEMFKGYHDELTYILRFYLEDRFSIKALEMTTAEILEQVEEKGMLKEQLPRLKQLLEKADLIKFAKSTPPLEFHRQALELVGVFIEETKDETITKQLGKEEYIEFFE